MIYYIKILYRCCTLLYGTCFRFLSSWIDNNYQSLSDTESRFHLVVIVQKVYNYNNYTCVDFRKGGHLYGNTI